jgi:Protein of unknown function (DUF2865)
MQNWAGRRSGAMSDRMIAVAVAAVMVGCFIGSGSQAAWAQQANDGGFQAQPQVMSQRQLYCRQLEQQLANEGRQQQNVRDSLPRIDAEISRADRAFQQGQAQAERLECFDYFLFSKDWRQTPRCVRLRQQIEGAERELSRLQRQREQISTGQVQQTRQDALIAELGRNQCGAQYVREASRRSGSGNFFWDDSEGDPGFGAQSLPTPAQTTYRTLCVRSCDGYYFPISFTASQQSFQRDANMCQSQCAAPARLFIYQNPGAEVEQAVSVDGTTAYSRLPNAFRYRRELVKGCSCKSAEYDSSQFPGDVGAETATLAPVEAGQAMVAEQPETALFQGDEPVPVPATPARKPRRAPVVRPDVVVPKYLR